MSVNSKSFWFRLPRSKEDLDNGSMYLVGFIEVWAIGYMFDDNTFKGVDIEMISFFRGNEAESSDVYGYIKDCQPDVYEELERQAVQTFKAHIDYVPIEESTPNC